MKYKDFVEALILGREIEFELKGSKYFISHDEKNYSIWDEVKLEYIFLGTIDEMLTFEFLENITFNNNFSEFLIKFIL